MTKTCAGCGETFTAARRDKRFCGPSCRRKAWTSRSSATARPTAVLPGPVHTATRQLLVNAGVDLDADLACSALRLAEAVDDLDTPPSALPGLTRALPAVVRDLT